MGNGVKYLWAVAGLYLGYLGIQQFVLLFRGEASIPLLNGAAGLLFLAVGGAVLLREWRSYRKGGRAQEPAEDLSEGEDDEEYDEGSEEDEGSREDGTEEDA